MYEPVINDKKIMTQDCLEIFSTSHEFQTNYEGRNFIHF